MTDAEIAGFMHWRGPGAYTQHQMRRIYSLLDEAERRERQACAKACEELPPPASCNGVERSLWDVAKLSCKSAILARNDHAA